MHLQIRVNKTEQRPGWGELWLEWAEQGQVGLCRQTLQIPPPPPIDFLPVLLGKGRCNRTRRKPHPHFFF